MRVPNTRDKPYLYSFGTNSFFLCQHSDSNEPHKPQSRCERYLPPRHREEPKPTALKANGEAIQVSSDPWAAAMSSACLPAYILVLQLYPPQRDEEAVGSFLFWLFPMQFVVTIRYPPPSRACARLLRKASLQIGSLSPVSPPTA